MKQKNIRIKDIAAMAGVSEGTVDRVIHKRGKVSSDAADKVNKVLAEIEYTPNLLARTLGTARNYRLIAVIPHPESDPYWKQSFEGLEQGEAELAQFGITMSVERFFYDPTKKESFQQVTLKAFHSKPDGILVAPLFYYASVSFLKELSESKIPFIQFNTRIEQAKSLSFIGQDLFQSGRLAAELISLGNAGNSSYILLHVEEDLPNSIHLLEKEKGFKNYFETELAPQPNHIKSYTLPDSTHVLFEKELQSILRTPNLKGIYVTNSKAYLIATYLEKEKQQVRLIGYDLVEENINYLRKGMIQFIIHQNPKRQAKLGIRTLVNYLLFDKKPTALNLFPLEVITKTNLDSYQI
jgi:LacI family transcriptional regulator